MTELIDATNGWLSVVREEEIDSTALVPATQRLLDELHKTRTALPGDEWPHTLHPQFSQSHHIIMAVVGLSGQFLWGEYTDSDTDAPCDIEWDLHHLQKDLDPDYIIPEDVEPAYVMGTVYPAPDGN